MGIKTNLNTSILSNYSNNTGSNISNYVSNSNSPTFHNYYSNYNGVTVMNLDYHSLTSKYSKTGHSDSDNVNINQIRTIIKSDKNDLTKMQKADTLKMIAQAFMNDKGLSEEQAMVQAEYCLNVILDCYGVSNITKALELNDGELPYIDYNKLVTAIRNEKEIYGSNDKYIKYDDDYYVTLVYDLQRNVRDYYGVYSDYITGKTLKEVYSDRYKNMFAISDELVKLYPISDDQFGFKKFQAKRIAGFLASDDLRGRTFGLSDDLLDSKIVEVVNEKSGYSSMVLELKNGKYAIVNSCTNADERTDLCAIIYAALQRGCDPKYVDELSENIIGPLLYKSNWEKYKENGVTDTDNYLEGSFEGQIDDCQKLIEKYCNSDKKVELYGYSLGGGIMEAAYARCLMDQSDSKADYLNNITSVSVYNPYTLLAQQDNENSINVLAQDDKFIRYCTERDVVSTFNDSVEALQDKTVYIKADKLDCNEVCAIDLFTGGNHAFAPINKGNSFNKYGNIDESCKGHFVSLQNVLNELDGLDDDPTTNNDYSPKYEIILPMLLEQLKDVDVVQNILEHKVGGPVLNPIYDPISQYVGMAYGELNPNILLLFLGSSLSDYAWDMLQKKSYYVGDFLFDENDFKSVFTQCCVNHKKTVYTMIEAYFTGDKDLFRAAANSFSHTFVKSLKSESIGRRIINVLVSGVIIGGASDIASYELLESKLADTLVNAVF